MITGLSFLPRILKIRSDNWNRSVIKRDGCSGHDKRLASFRMPDLTENGCRRNFLDVETVLDFLVIHHLDDRNNDTGMISLISR